MTVGVTLGHRGAYMSKRTDREGNDYTEANNDDDEAREVDDVIQ